MSRPGERLRRWTARVCSARTMEHVIDPLFADMQHECEEAVREKRRARRFRVLAAGYLAFWKLVALRAPGWAARQIFRDAAADNWAVGRVAAYSIVATVLLTALLMAVPIHRLVAARGRRLLDDHLVWEVLLMIPGTLPVAVPLALLIGVLCGLWRRDVTSRFRRGIVILGITASLAMLGTISWLVPVADRVWLATVSRAVGPERQVQLRRVTREDALRLRESGRPGRAGQLLLGFHQRIAVAGAALAFPLFALSVSGRRISPAAKIALVCAAPLFYVGVSFAASSVFSPLLSDERIAVLVAWLPNVLLMTMSAASASSDAWSG